MLAIFNIILASPILYVRRQNKKMKDTLMTRHEINVIALRVFLKSLSPLAKYAKLFGFRYFTYVTNMYLVLALANKLVRVLVQVYPLLIFWVLL